MKQDHCGQEEDSYQGLVLDSEIRSLTKSLDDKRQSRRSSTTETMSAVEHDVVSLPSVCLSLAVILLIRSLRRLSSGVASLRVWRACRPRLLPPVLHRRAC
jgi:hypothetical protein